MGVTFNGVHCSTLGLEVNDSRRPLLAESKDTYVDVPHRNGSIQVFDESKLDIEVEVDFFLNPIVGKTYFDACRDIAAWLTTKHRVQLVFDDDPQWAYMAKVVGSATVERIADSGLFTITFRCEPVMIEVV